MNTPALYEEIDRLKTALMDAEQHLATIAQLAGRDDWDMAQVKAYAASKARVVREVLQ